jgi:hypothetical protein
MGSHRHFSPEDGGSMFLQNVGIYLRVYTASQPRRTSSSSAPLDPQVLLVCFLWWVYCISLCPKSSFIADNSTPDKLSVEQLSVELH